MRANDIKFYRIPDELREKVFNLRDNEHLQFKQIAQKLNIEEKTVKTIIKQRADKERDKVKYSNSIGVDLFLEENKPLFWYLIGLFTTDGHLNYNENARFSKSIDIFQKDHKFLVKLQNLLKHDGKIYISTTQTGDKVFKLTILDHKLWDYLFDHEFSSDKRYSAKWLNCPKEYLNYYYRGLIDGDGCICYNYTSGTVYRLVVQLTSGSQEIVTNFKNSLETNLNIPSNIHNKISTAGNKYYDLSIRSYDNVLKFCNYIYSGNLEFKLTSKYVKYLKLLEIIKIDKQINDIVDTL